jgi:hypothetical protein
VENVCEFCAQNKVVVSNRKEATYVDEALGLTDDTRQETDCLQDRRLICKAVHDGLLRGDKLSY